VGRSAAGQLSLRTGRGALVVTGLAQLIIFSLAWSHHLLPGAPARGSKPVLDSRPEARTTPVSDWRFNVSDWRG